MLEEGADRCQPNLTQEDTDKLVREVQAHNLQTYGTMSKPPWADEVTLTLEKVAFILKRSSPGIENC